MLDVMGNSKFKKVLDILGVATIPFVFIFSIIYDYGYFRNVYFASLVILVAVWLAVCIIERKTIVFPKVYWFLAAVAVTVVATSSLSIIILHIKREMYNEYWTYFVYVDAAALIIAMLLNSCRKNLFKLGVRLTSSFVLATGVYGTIAYVVKVLVTMQTDMEEAKVLRAASVYDNPIPGGHIILMFLWIPFSLRYDELDEKGRLRDGLIRILVYIPFIILTQSRSVWVGLIFSVALYVITNRKELAARWKKLPKKRRSIIFAGMTTAMLICGAFAVILIAPRFEELPKTESYVVRTNYMPYTLHEVSESSIFRKLFGHGAGSSREMIEESPCFVEPYNICDNAYLSMLYDWGIVAGIAVIVIDILAIKLIKNSNKSKTSDIEKSCAYALISCILPIFFYDAQLWVMVGVLMATFIAGANKNDC